MKITNRILGFLLNAAVMAVVVLIIKYQADIKLEIQKYNFAVYSNLLQTNTKIVEGRTNKVNQLLARIEAAQTASSTAVKTPVKKANITNSPTSSIRLPAPSPVLSIPIKPNRTTKTS